MGNQSSNTNIASSSSSSKDNLVPESVLEESFPFLACHICFSIPQSVRITPCGHSFCSHCINSIFRNSLNKNCPLCRKPVIKTSIKSNSPVNKLLQLLYSGKCNIFDFSIYSKQSCQRFKYIQSLCYIPVANRQHLFDLVICPYSPNCTFFSFPLF